MKWYFKQLLPLTYWTKYTDVNEDKKYFVIWKMWFGKCFDELKFEIK